MNTNPFVLSPAIPDEFFCDRQNESASLIKSINNQENVVLISPRRVGKTGLIYHCFNQPEIRDNYITVSIDILHTTSFQELIKELGSAVFNTGFTLTNYYFDKIMKIEREELINFMIKDFIQQDIVNNENFSKIKRKYEKNSELISEYLINKLVKITTYENSHEYLKNKSKY